jgi:putative toxin-antitoxin system antitoxin component (TIGR02293 family)
LQGVLDRASIVPTHPRQIREVAQQSVERRWHTRHARDKLRDTPDGKGTYVADIAERLGSAAARAELDQSDIARVLDTNPRTVSRWLQRTSAPRPDARERLLELLAVLEELSRVLRPQAAHDWLFTPNPLLDHYKPVDLLRDGKSRPVLGAIDAMAEGVFV